MKRRSHENVNVFSNKSFRFLIKWGFWDSHSAGAAHIHKSSFRRCYATQGPGLSTIWGGTFLEYRSISFLIRRDWDNHSAGSAHIHKASLQESLRMFLVLCVRPADIRCIFTNLFKYRRRYAVARRRSFYNIG